MKTRLTKKEDVKRQSSESPTVQKQKKNALPNDLKDQRPQAVAQRKLKDLVNQSKQVRQLQAFQTIANRSRPTIPPTSAVQRKVNFIGSKAAKSARIPANAKYIANRIKSMGGALLAGGVRYIANVANKGVAGYRIGKKEYVGGIVFNNTPMPDGQRLPVTAYTEWDIHPAVAGKGRGGERIVKSAGGKFYYTHDHYDNFTEFAP